MNRLVLAAALALAACAHTHTPAQEALLKRGDCASLLRAADEARAKEKTALAQQLAQGCARDKLLALVDASTPAEGLLWCGRAVAAAPDRQACDARRIADLTSRLRPHITVGPADPSAAVEPLFIAAVRELEPETNLAFEADGPDVIVGRMSLTVDHATSVSTASVPDAQGRKHQVPATQHRFVARAEAQVELGNKTRTLRASEEARDATWEAAPRLAIGAKFEPSVPPLDELRHRAALAWVRSLGRALASSPPESVEAGDACGCVAYGLALNLTSADSSAAANGRGEAGKIAACEKLLGEPAGAGIPVP